MNRAANVTSVGDALTAATGVSTKIPVDLNTKVVNHEMQEYVGIKVLECAADTRSKTVNKEAKLQAPDRVEQAVKSTGVENATVNRAAGMGGNSMVKGAGHALEAIHNTNAAGWSVVHRQNASPNKRNAPVHTNQVNTPKKVSTSNSFGVLVSEPVMDDTGKRVQQLEREATPKTSHSNTPHSVKQNQKSEATAAPLNVSKDMVIVDNPKAVEGTGALALEEDEVIKDRSQDLREKINEITGRQEEKAFDRMLPRIKTWVDRAEYEEEENWENGADDERDDSVEQESGQQQRRPNSQEAAYDGQSPGQQHQRAGTQCDALLHPNAGQQQDVPISFMAGQQQQITSSLLQQQHHNASTSGAIANMALISDHDRALLDTLDSPKPHRCAYSTGSKTTSQKMKVSVAKSAKRMKRHDPLWMVIQEEANQKLEANLRVAISDEAEEYELIESCPEEAATSGDFSPKHSEKKEEL
ncbi:hypothetical protein A4A49_38764 [Nicotiana attenuata]|uniref:Uncharacterized protein n=1 Tax=Nicotiana attenuata TaxID=49451 RepID=A0A1J6IHI1_NICAT|nr:hypothetical protein A4A49_38764 [Nicotiana attenuata]